MESEEENALLRIQTQGMVISNLIAQRDMSTSIKVASDSRELAAASRNDSAAMRTIAVLTTVFLPGAFVAVRYLIPVLKVSFLKPPILKVTESQAVFTLPLLSSKYILHIYHLPYCYTDLVP